MAAYFGETGRAIPRRFEVATEYRRCEIVRDCGPRTFDPLAAVKGIFASHAFSPAVCSVTVGSEQQHAAAVRAPEARLEKMDERHMNLAERDSLNLHRLRKLRIYHGRRETRSKTRTSKAQIAEKRLSPCFCAFVVRSLLRRIRPLLIPFSEQELAVAFRVALEPQ